MLYMGIDPSLTGTGVVLYDSSKKTHDILLIKTKPAKKDKSSPKKKKDSADDFDRLFYIAREIEKLLYKNSIDFIYIEAGVFSRTGKAYTRYQLIALIVYFAKQLYDVPVVAVHPLSLKKQLTGYGRSKGKENIEIHCYSKYGFKHSDDNVVDAYCLSRYGEAVEEHKEKLPVDRL